MKLDNFSFEIKIVFDNRCNREGFLTGFGFSALIYNHFTRNFLLFDTGGNSNVLINNIKKYNLELSEIKKVIISHNHHDHTGGLEGIYRNNTEIQTYVPLENLPSLKKSFPNVKIHGISELINIEKNVFSSGQLGTSIKEQALFLKTKDNEIIIIVGCAHPGLEKFILKAKKMSKVIAIIGGFHGFQKYSYLEGIDFIGGCHCTVHLDTLHKRFPEQFKTICVGHSLKF